jgi:hypothetical protein
MLFTLIAAALGAVAGVASAPVIDHVAGARWRLAYALLLPVIALIYVGFALWGGGGFDLLLAALGVAVFSFMAGLGLGQSPWWLPGGLALHAGWDLFHHDWFLHGGIPGWYPMFCFAFDLGLAAMLARRISAARA